MTIDNIGINNVRVGEAISLGDDAGSIKTSIRKILELRTTETIAKTGHATAASYVPCDLFIDNSHWTYKDAKRINIPDLDKSLADFYSSYRYMELNGTYYISPEVLITYHFTDMYDEEHITKEAQRVAKEMRQKGYARLCPCEINGIGRTLLCYSPKKVFLLIWNNDSNEPKKI